MKNKKYFPTTIEKQKILTASRLNEFISNPTSKVIFMNEPVGYGKTTTLMDLCLSPDETGKFRRSIFLTYSNWKAEELEGEFLERIKDLKHKPRLLRVFGAKHISEEKRYRLPDDIETCENPYERQVKIDNGEPAILVCKNKCKKSEVCPYYRTVTSARENAFDILIGNLNEMQTASFYSDSKFKFSETDLFILDEDAIKKSKFEFNIAVEHMVPFVDFLPQFPKLVDEDKENLLFLSQEQKEVLKSRFEKIKMFFFDESGFMAKEGNLNYEKLKSRGFVSKRISAEGNRSSFKKMDDESKQTRYDVWYRKLLQVVESDCQVELEFDREKGRAVIWCFPNIKDYKKVFNEVGVTKNSQSKVIITDATSDLLEVVARLRINDAEELDLSYHPLKDGYMIPKGEIFQVVDNVSRQKLFDKNTHDLKKNDLKDLLMAVRSACNDLNFSENETWIIPFQHLAKEELFHKECKSLGFITNPDFYHGGVRGLNEIKDKDLVILGANFPHEDGLVRQQISDLSTPVKFNHSDDFLRWIVDSNGNHIDIEVVSARMLKADGWMNFVTEKGFGSISRKVYLESVIQSMRSRFFWNKTKTLVFSMFPMTDYGIAVHKLLSRDEFKYKYYKAA